MLKALRAQAQLGLSERMKHGKTVVSSVVAVGTELGRLLHGHVHDGGIYSRE